MMKVEGRVKSRSVRAVGSCVVGLLRTICYKLLFMVICYITVHVCYGY
jgi:hypothetical protein